MLEIREVKTKKEIKDFLRFTETHYDKNPYYVPELYGDQAKMFKKNYMYYDQAESVFFNAYLDGKMVGRIQGINQKVSNEKHNEKKVRFTRFESINDQSVANGLLDAVSNWGKEKGLNQLCGPMGFSDLEREGMLVEGFDKISTFETFYNYEYYQTLMDNYGLKKDVDWLERQLRLPKEKNDRFERLNDYIMKRYKLHYGTAKNINDFLKKYKEKIFEIIDITYDELYGTVPFTDGMKKLIISNFKLLLDLRFVSVVCDEDERIVCFGITVPSIAKAVQKSKGHLTPGCIYRILRDKKKPEVVDLALIGVLPEYESKGVSTLLIAQVNTILNMPSVKYTETLCNLEDNLKIINCWKNYDNEVVRRRRSYIKDI